MTTLALAFIPVLALVILANLAQDVAWARWPTLALSLSLALLSLLGGLAMLVLPPERGQALLAAGLEPDLPKAGVWLVIAGALAVAPPALVVASHMAGRDMRSRILNWSRPLPTVAMVLAILFAGFNLALAALISDPDKLAALGLRLGVSDLATQALGFLLLALFGVGLGIRRDARATLARLGLTRPTWQGGLATIGGTLGLLALSSVLGALLAWLAPTSTADAESFNRLLTGAFRSPFGALILGLLSGVSEEILYRGALQPVFGLWATSLIFAMHHIQYLSPALVLIFLLGLALGWIRNHHGTTVAALVHAAYNTTLLLLALLAANLTNP